jgi:hypothetical protein
LPALSFLRVVGPAVKLSQEADDFLAFESSVTSAVNAVCPYHSFVTPAPQGVGMYVEKISYFPDREQFTHAVTFSHIFSYILFN